MQSDRTAAGKLSENLDFSLRRPGTVSIIGGLRGLGHLAVIYGFDDCVLDSARRELRRGNVLQPVEPQVFDLLEYLVQKRDRVVSRDEIFAAVWRGRIVSDATLGTRINAARQAVGDNGTEQRLIKTLYGRGLRFVGTVHEKSDGTAPGKNTAITESPAAPRRRFSLAVNDVPAIFVRPFTPIGDNAGTRLFAEGLTEEVSTALSASDWLFVLSRHSSFAEAGKHNARYLLHGSVRQSAGQARIGAQLVDSATGYHLWARSYDIDSAHMLRVQEDIARSIALAAEDQIFTAEAARAKLKSPESLSAWEYIVGALALMNTRQKHHVRMARALLLKAVAADPKSAHAYSLLSFLTTLAVHLGWNSRETSKPIAVGFAEKALAIDSDEPWGHLAHGYATLHTDNKPEEAIETLNYALALEPNLSMAHYFIALASTYASRPDVAFKHADLAEQLAPRDLLARGNVGAPNTVRATASFVAGRYRDGMAYARKALVQSPRQVPAFRQIAISAAHAGEMEQAKLALQSVKRFSPNVRQWLVESEPIYSRKHDYHKYVEGFRMAGLK